MKSISVFLFTFLISLNCFAQSLEGEWKGSFTLFNPAATVAGVSAQGYCFPAGGYVNLKFILNKDSSYTVYSIYKGSDTMNVCEVSYKRISKDSIYLEETKIIKPKSSQMSRSFQKMTLKINPRKKSIQLIGRFDYVSSSACNLMLPGSLFGDISFYKKTE